jgi:hypothetical protein
MIDLTNPKHSYITGHLWIDTFANLVKFLIPEKQKYNDIMQAFV